MDFGKFFHDTLQTHGFDPVVVPNAYVPPYDPNTGWNCKLPNVDFGPQTILLINLQDFVTIKNHRVLELDLIEQNYKQWSSKILVAHFYKDLQQLYSGPLNLVEFCSHNYRLIHLLKQQSQQWQQQMQQPKSLSWMSLNGRRCQHRQRVVQMLQTWPNGVLSYSDIIPLPIWTYHNHFGTDNDQNFLKLQPVYGQHMINVVTETEYDPTHGLISEKTILPMLACQIPIVIGYRGIVQRLRSMGLDTFEDVVDISYDDLPNDQRAEQALLRNQDLLLGQRDVRHLHQRLIAQQHYVLEMLPRWYESQFQQKVVQLAKSLHQ